MSPFHHNEIISCSKLQVNTFLLIESISYQSCTSIMNGTWRKLIFGGFILANVNLIIS